MRGRLDPQRRATCLKLRTKRRLSYGEIRARTGTPKSTLSLWLSGHPLTPKETDQKRNHRGRPRSKHQRGPDSKLHGLVNGRGLIPSQIGTVAELAVATRLAAVGFSVAKPIADGDVADWIAKHRTLRRPLNIQVKSVHRQRTGRDVIRVTRPTGEEGRRTYQKDELDFIVGYDLQSDTAYVFSFEEIRRAKASISVRGDAEEAWHKLLPAQGHERVRRAATRRA